MTLALLFLLRAPKSWTVLIKGYPPSTFGHLVSNAVLEIPRVETEVSPARLSTLDDRKSSRFLFSGVGRGINSNGFKKWGGNEIRRV